MRPIRMILDVERMRSDGWTLVLPPRGLIYGTPRKGSKLWKALANPKSPESALEAREWYIESDPLVMVALGGGRPGRHAGTAGVLPPTFNTSALEMYTSMSTAVKERLFREGVYGQRCLSVWALKSFWWSGRTKTPEWGVCNWEVFEKWWENTNHGAPPKKWTRERLAADVRVVDIDEALEMIKLKQIPEPKPMVSVQWGYRSAAQLYKKFRKDVVETLLEMCKEQGWGYHDVRVCVGFEEYGEDDGMEYKEED